MHNKCKIRCTSAGVASCWKILVAKTCLLALKGEMDYKSSRRFRTNKLQNSRDLIRLEVVLIVRVKGTVKQSLYKPGENLRVPGSKN